MTGSTGDNVPDPGWGRFRSELKAELQAVADVDAVIVEVVAPPQTAAVQSQESWLSRKLRSKRAHGGLPYVQFAALDETWLHMEASSNTFLAPEWQIDDAAVVTLERLGWSAPTGGGSGRSGSPNYFIDRPLADAPDMVAVAVQTFTGVFGVRDTAALRIIQV